MRVEVNGVKLFFDVEGARLVPDGGVMREKPTLILLHGGPGLDHSSYKPAFSQFTDIAQVVYIDHRGNGRSERGDPATWNLAQWGDDVKTFCDVLEIEKPIVLGNSFGGYVAMAYATRHPQHAGKLILGSTRAATPDFERPLAVFRRLGGVEARDVAAHYFANASQENRDEFYRVCLPLYNRQPADPNGRKRAVQTTDVLDHFRRDGGELHTFDFFPCLPGIVCPTLVMGGEDDPMIPIEDQEDIAAALPPQLVRFERFADCGHG
ncbi:MAG: alpha/beta hydrolase, partial [Anaerolineaceae bacterium]